MRVALWSLKGEMVEVGLLPSVSGEIQLFGLNDFGSLIGNTILTSGSMTSFLIRPDMSVEKIQSIIKEPILWASDLNNYEDIIGVSALKDPSTGRAWIWNGTGGITWLGSLGPFHSLAIALGVNNHRQVVGISSRSGQVGKLYDRLATQIKSWFPTMTLPRKRYHAFLWEKGKMYSLDSLINSESGWELEYAWNINDLGQIVGEGALNGITHMFLLTPINDSSSDDGG
jgi:uncharacterized membrane protein